MTIPTRDELIERAKRRLRFFGSDGDAPAIAADFALAEIRRAVAEDLEALRGLSYDEGHSWRDQVAARLAALRAASAPVPVPKPVDVFEASASEIYDACDQVCGSDDVATTAKILRDRFGPLVAAMKKVEGGSDDPLAVSIAGEALSALRQRAQEASR